MERLKELWTETMVDSNDVIWCPDGGMEDFAEDSHSDGGLGCAEVDDDHDMWNNSEDLEEDIDWDVWSKEDSFDGDDGDIDDELVSDSDEDEGRNMHRNVMTQSSIDAKSMLENLEMMLQELRERACSMKKDFSANFQAHCHATKMSKIACLLS